MIKLTLIGDVPSKKNSKQIIYVRGRPLIIPSKNHKIWHTQAMNQLLGKRPVESKIQRVEMVLYACTKRKADLSNRWESIGDLLVDAGVIEDDNYFVLPELNLKFGGVDKLNPRAEITIYETNTTYPKPNSLN